MATNLFWNRSLRGVTLVTALGIRAGNFCGEIGSRFDCGVVTLKAVGMVRDLVVQLYLFAILRNYRQRFAVIAGLQMT